MCSVSCRLDPESALIEIIISPSELDVMRQCPLRHQLLYGERWTKPIRDESHPLAFGTLWHTIMDGHYRAIQYAQASAHREFRRWQAFDRVSALLVARTYVNGVLAEIADPEVAELLAWMYQGHLDRYELDEQWQIMAVEFNAQTALPGPIDSPIQFRIKMKIDLLVKEQGRIWIIDHKSCKNLPKKIEMDLDDQFGLYHWGMSQLGYSVFGMYHSAARKERLKREMTLDERFLRSPMTRGRTELDRIAMEAWQTAHERYRGIQEVTDMKRKGIDIESPRHPQPIQCGWKCDFTEACIAGRKGTDLRDYVSRKGYRQDRSRH